MKLSAKILAGLALLLFCGSAKAQGTMVPSSIPCIDPQQVNAPPKYTFDLFIGGMVFTGGVVVSSQANQGLTSEELDDLIRQVANKFSTPAYNGGRPVGTMLLCGMIGEMQGRINRMKNYANSEFWEAASDCYLGGLGLNMNYGKAWGKYGMDMTIDLLLGKSSIPGLSNVYNMAKSIFKACPELFDKYNEAEKIINEGVEAQAALNSFYSQVRAAIRKYLKEKNKRAAWQMILDGGPQKYQGKFWGIGCTTEVSVSLHLDKKISDNDADYASAEGQYEGNLILTLNGLGEFDEWFKARIDKVTYPMNRYYKLAPQGKNMVFTDRYMKNTRYKQVIKSTNVKVFLNKTIVQIYGQFNAEKPDFSFEHYVDAGGNYQYCGGGACVHARLEDNYKLTSTDASTVTIEHLGGQQQWWSIPTPPPSLVPRPDTRSYMDGWLGDNVSIGSNDLQTKVLQTLRYAYLRMTLAEEAQK
jgi:hypothetical protein